MSDCLYTNVRRLAIPPNPFAVFAAEMDRDPRIRRYRLAVYISNRASNRAKAAKALQEASRRPPPVPPRRQCYRPHRADSSNGDDADAR
jgi:hypothetical protein